MEQMEDIKLETFQQKSVTWNLWRVGPEPGPLAASLAAKGKYDAPAREVRDADPRRGEVLSWMRRIMIIFFSMIALL